MKLTKLRGANTSASSTWQWRGGGGRERRCTHKSRRVVIPDGLGIAKGFQHRVGLDHLIFKVSLGLSDKAITNAQAYYIQTHYCHYSHNVSHNLI